MLLFLGRQRTAGIDDHRRESHVFLLGHLFQQLIAGQIGQVQVHHHAIEGGLAQAGQCVGGRAHADQVDVLAGQQLADAVELARIVLDHQYMAQALQELGFQLADRTYQFFSLHRLQCVADGTALQCLVRIIGHRDHVYRDVAGLGIALDLIQHAQAGEVRQVHVHQDGAGAIHLRRRHALIGRMRDHALEAHLVRQVAQDHGEGGVILDHQDQARGRFNAVTVIIDGDVLKFRRRTGHHLRAGDTDIRRGSDLRRLQGRSRRRRCGNGRRRPHYGLLAAVNLRQREREDTALAYPALHLNIAPQQMRQVARDRQAQPGAAVLAMGAAIGLAEGFEDELMLVGPDADAGIAHGEGDAAAGIRIDAQADLALLGELDGVGEQVLEDLAQALHVRFHTLRHARFDLDLEAQALLLGRHGEAGLEFLGHLADHKGFGNDIQLARFHLREIEDVVDQGQQVIAGRGNGLRETHLLVGQVALLVVGQQLGQDQGGVQRGTQLVAHVGQELALVLVGALQLGGFFHQHHLGLGQVVLLDFQQLRLLFQLGIGFFQLGLLGFQAQLRGLQGLALLFQLFVVDAQFFLLGLQFLGLALSFFQQFFQTGAVLGGTHGNGDLVRQARQQLFFLGPHLAQEAKFKHGLHHTIGRCGHDQQLTRCMASHGRGNGQVLRRHFLDVHGAIEFGGLAQQALAITQVRRLFALVFFQRIGGEALEVAAIGAQVDGADLSIEVGSQEGQRVFTQRPQALFALQALGQAHLAIADPGLFFAGAIIARSGHGCGNDEHQQQARAAPGDGSGKHHGIAPVGLAAGQQVAFLFFHVARQHAHAVHEHFAAIGLHHGQCARCIAIATAADGLGQFFKFVGDHALDLRQALQLIRIVGEQLAQPGDLPRQRGACLVVGAQIGFGAREQETALAGLGILERGDQHLQLLAHLHGVRDGIGGQAPADRGFPGKQGNQHHRQDGDGKTDQRPQRQRRSGKCALALALQHGNTFFSLAGINPHGALRCSNRWSSCGGSVCRCVPLPLVLRPGKPPIIRAASGLRRAPVRRLIAHSPASEPG